MFQRYGSKGECGIRLLYRTFPSRWNNAKCCSLWLTDLRSATEPFESPFFLPLTGFLSEREKSWSSIIAPLISPREHVTIMSSTFLVGRNDELSRKCWLTMTCKAFIINVGATGLKLHKINHFASTDRLQYHSPNLGSTRGQEEVDRQSAPDIKGFITLPEGTEPQCIVQFPSCTKVTHNNHEWSVFPVLGGLSLHK